MKGKAFRDRDNQALHEKKMNESVRMAVSRQNIEFILAHQHDSREELARYLRQCKKELGHIPAQSEVIGGDLLALRFGSWVEALNYSGYVDYKGPALSALPLERTAIFQEEYTHPEAAESEETGANGVAVPYASTYKLRPTSEAKPENGTVDINAWHKHSYFPLYNNYFVALNGLSTSLNGLVPPLTGLDLTTFGSYKAKDTTPAELTLKGVKLVVPKTTSGGNSTAPDDFLFGYVDCHPNGLRSNVQLNPYTTGRTSNTTSNGDPMDLSWAVDDDGNPVYLDSVRYVRVYTGVQQMNGIMGESSTEVLGSHRAVKKGATAAVAPTIKVGGFDLNTLQSMGVSVSTTQVEGSPNQQIITISGASMILSTSFAVEATGGTYVYMNGVATTTSNVTVDAGTALVQVINQTGEGNAFITLLKISA